MNIEIYTTENCSYCKSAKALLKTTRLTFSEVNISKNKDEAITMVKRSGKRSVPQIFVDGVSVGGFEELQALHRTGKLTQE